MAHRSRPRPLHRILVAVAWWRGDRRRDFANVIDIFLDVMECLGRWAIVFRVAHLHGIRRRVRRCRGQRQLGRGRHGTGYAGERSINEQRKRWRLQFLVLFVLFVILIVLR